MTATANLIDTIEAMTAEQRAGALVVLDALTRPLTAREIEGALRMHGVQRSRAVVMACSVKRLALVAVVGGET